MAAHSFVPRDVAWRYLDDGAELTDPSWRTTGFYDDTWLLGRAELGFGDGDESTLVRCHRSQTVAEPTCPLGDPAGRIVTTYFRREFSLVPEAERCLILDYLVDDGAIAYLNGVELGRINMPGGLTYPWTLAESEVVGDGERRWWSLPLDPALLVEGTNTLAVEVHIGEQNSEDLSFAAGLNSSCRLFRDDFEWGDTQSWSNSSP